MIDIGGVLISNVDEDNEVSIGTIGPSAIFINEEQLEEIIENLQERLDTIRKVTSG